ncbi:MAG TPA: cytochrome d ubiquinol oxidase subunit II [Candidatus Tyrphobacter sp.]
MTIFAFVLVAFMLLVYVLLDGYDLGVAAAMPLVARTERERAATMSAIGPFWNGNEVWLIAAAAVLFALFPKAYASAFSGFYLPFILVLWLLMARGIAMEVRGHFPSSIWHEFWDTAFWLGSALLIVIFGIALGNLLRGLPLDPDGYFMGTFAYLLNPYAILVGLFAVEVLVEHGLLFLVLRVDGALAGRARRFSLWLSHASVVGYIAVTAATFAVRGLAMARWPLAAVAIASLASLVALRICILRKRDGAAFLASCAFIATLLTEAAATLFPYLLPAPLGQGGISVYDVQPNPVALVTAIVSTVVGLCVLGVYAPFAMRRMLGKVRVEE